MQNSKRIAGLVGPALVAPQKPWTQVSQVQAAAQRYLAGALVAVYQGGRSQGGLGFYVFWRVVVLAALAVM